MRRDKMVLLSKALDISPLVLLGIEEYVSEGTTTYSNDKVVFIMKCLLISLGCHR